MDRPRPVVDFENVERDDLLERVLELTNSRIEIFESAGRSIDEWVSRWPPSLREEASVAVEAARAGRRARFGGHVATAAGGTSFEISIDPMTIEGSEPGRLLVVLQDVTGIASALGALPEADDRIERAGMRSEKFLRLAEASDDFIIIAGLDRSIEYVNGALLRASEVETVREFVAMGRLAFFAPDERKTFEGTIVPALLRDGRWSGPMQFRSFKSGTMLPVAYQAFVLRDDAGKPVGLASVSRDIGDRRRVEIGMRALAETGAAMYASLDVESTLRNVANAVVRTFATYCIVDVLTADGSLRSIGASSRDKRYAKLVEIAAQTRALDDDHPVWRAVRQGDSTLIASMPQEWLSDIGIRSVLGDAADELDVHSLLYVPLQSRQDGGIYGSLTCLLDSRDPRGHFTVDDLRFCEEIAVRAGLALDHARAYERERRIAVTLQEASLPQVLPALEGLMLSADYRPGSGEATIGGDWYDAFTLDDGRVAITIGDVVGHGLSAAVTMGKVRQAMQAVAAVAADPNVMLDVADRVVRSESGDAYATALAGIFDPRAGTFTFASAGHPGPLVRAPSGDVHDRTSTTALLGMRGSDETTQHTFEVAAGSLLIFFTDGLSEVARDVMEGTRAIREAIADPAIAFAASPARALVEQILGEASASDDIAVLVAAVGTRAQRDLSPRPSHERRPRPEIAVSFEANARPRNRAKILIVPARLAEVSGVRRTMRSLVETSDDASRIAETVELATGEIVANAVKYGTGTRIEVSLSTEDGGVVIAVTNAGEPFELGTRDVSEMLLAERGRGLAILRALGCTLDVTVARDRCTVAATIPFAAATVDS